MFADDTDLLFILSVLSYPLNWFATFITEHNIPSNYVDVSRLLKGLWMRTRENYEYLSYYLILALASYTVVMYAKRASFWD